MTETQTDQPNLYLVTPTSFELSTFLPRLEAVLDAEPIACVRLALVTDDEHTLAHAADACREVCHARDVPLVLTGPAALAERLGLDGVHLTDGARNVRATRKALGADAIVGAYCASSRHDGMSAGEAGADYIAFGPLGANPLSDAEPAEHELFAWWSEMIELPVVAEGALTPELVRAFAPVTDFFAIGPEIWREEDAVAALRHLIAPIR
jgi:thiamine-phosphate pyrophosphorylase